MNMVGANNRRLCTLLLCLLLSCSLTWGSGDDIYCLKSIIKSLDPFNNLSWSWNFTNATTDGFICEFVGIDCWHPDENRVLNIRLPDMGLKGRFPRGIKNCSSLMGLDLSNNDIYGTIPSDVSKILTFVVSLDLSANKFSGAIPASLGNCSYLNVLKLQNNSLSGRIPSQLGQLKRIKTFSVANNYLTGPVPNFANTSNITAESYANNSGLCGYPLDPCRSPA